MSETVAKERFSDRTRLAIRVAFSAFLWGTALFVLGCGVARTAPIILVALSVAAVLSTPGVMEWFAGRPTWSHWLGLPAGWGWALLAGGGGLGLMLTRGPLPLTNGWFAMFSGLAA